TSTLSLTAPAMRLPEPTARRMAAVRLMNQCGRFEREAKGGGVGGSEAPIEESWGRLGRPRAAWVSLCSTNRSGLFRLLLVAGRIRGRIGLESGEDGAGGSGRSRGAKDRAPHHDEISAGASRFRRRQHARLVA